MTQRFCVYTALFGNYETLNEQPVASDSSVDFICFTDNRQQLSSSWKMVYLDPILPMDFARSSRLYKICPHRFLKDYETSLYIDNSVILKLTPEKIFDDLMNTEAHLVCINHSYRDTVLDEFYEVLMAQ